MAYCDRCERYFRDDRALEQHEDASTAHWMCRPCGKDFTSEVSLEQHYVQSPRHDYCQTCDEHFDDDDELLDHLVDEHNGCRSCRKVFPYLSPIRISLTLFSQTFKNAVGYKAHMHQVHWYCEPCDRVFASESNLDSHSSVHKPKNFSCPGAGCNRAFVSQSALVLHWEAGACPSGITRNILNRNVVRLDHNHAITNPMRLIQGTTTNWATDLSWNGSGYECFLCNNEYRSLNSLNQHLQSPRHEARIYRCPNRDCGDEYSTLSALSQHVERDRCGVQRFREVKSAMDSLMSGVKRLAL